jgi:hypothetical protein
VVHHVVPTATAQVSAMCVVVGVVQKTIDKENLWLEKNKTVNKEGRELHRNETSLVYGEITYTIVATGFRNHK